ncbi:NnrU protein [Seongchinamella sediminis]|uniref:NnrU protein n=1 Tax=Seongchinamella sediminis TaxID=2283635 RepID=A0A3L7E236_9GAMM|nr:NnrU family protein [Seongchinamella sediminis]RLQ23566.1 NnrU protein [Seongchinamella sediminis]
MALLTLGVLLWAVTHLLPSISAPARAALVARIGENGYKGLFSLLTLAALALIIVGWRSIDQPGYLYTLPLWTRHLGMLLVLVAFILFVASGQPTRIKQYLRHPQLTGVILWAGAHLMMNGDARSLVLFGGLGLWALLEIIFINRRDGEWLKPEPPGIAQDLKLLVIAVLVYAAVAWAHRWLAGVAIF